MAKEKRAVRLRTISTWVVALTLMVVANLPYEIEESIVDQRMSEAILHPMQWIDKSISITAGWPIKFFASVVDNGDVVASAFSIGLLIGNIGIWVSLYVLWVLYEKLARPNSSQLTSRFNLSIMDLLVITAMIAAGVSYFSHLVSRSQKAKHFATLIQRSGGNCELSTRYPRRIGAVFRIIRELPGLSVSGAVLVEPNSEMLETTLALPYLRKLHLVGGSYDLKVLSRVQSCVFLRELKISHKTLDASSVAALSHSKQIAKLSLINTDLTHDGAELLGRLPHLKSLTLLGQDINSESLDCHTYSPSIEELTFSGASNPDHNSITIRGLPNLKHFYCSDFENTVSGIRTDIHFCDLPKLKYIDLNSFRLFNLKIDNAPQLESIRTHNVIDPSRLAGLSLLKAPQLVSLEVTDAPKLNPVACWPACLESIRLHSNSPIKIELSCSHDEHGVIPTSQLQGLLETIRNYPQVTEIGLDHIRLSSVDLSVLCEMQSLRSLKLRHTKLTESNWEQLRHLHQLDTIFLDGNPCDHSTLSDIARSLKNLRKLSIDSWMLDEISLENIPNIENVFSNVGLGEKGHPNLTCRALTLRDVPRLEEYLDFNQEIWLVKIEDAPNLRGISTRSRWPAHAALSGLRQLTYFIGGGANLDDRCAAALLECETMHQLVLAYSNVSSQLIAKLGALPRLKVVCFAGSNVDDEAIQSWPTENQIESLDLDDTVITDESMRKIANFPRLENLSVRSCRIGPRGIEVLGTAKKLRSLALSNLHIDREAMLSLKGLKYLTSLDLSGCKIDKAAFEILMNEPPPTLHALNLRKSNIESIMLDDLMSKHSEWSIDQDSQRSRIPSGSTVYGIGPTVTRHQIQQLLKQSNQQQAIRRPELGIPWTLSPKVFQDDPRRL